MSTSYSILALLSALTLAQTAPSPTPTTCPPTPAKRIVRKYPIGDPEWHKGPDKWCTGIACKVVEVLVTVNADGSVKNAIVKTGWDDITNYQVLQNARNSTYIPATLNCKPVEGTYIYREMLVRSD